MATLYHRELIAKLARSPFAGERVIVMPGGGVSEANLGELLGHTGCKEFHASARVSTASRMRHRDESGRDHCLV